MPRVIETSKHVFDTSEYTEIANDLDSKLTDADIKDMEDRLDIDTDDVKVINTYKNTLNYLKENRINMNFRQVDC